MHQQSFLIPKHCPEKQTNPNYDCKIACTGVTESKLKSLIENEVYDAQFVF